MSETFFERHLDKVNWLWLSRNPVCSEAFFERHLDKVNWTWLFGNNFQVYITNTLEKEFPLKKFT